LVSAPVGAVVLNATLLVASKMIASLRVVNDHIARRQSNARALLTHEFMQCLD
jgi:hypothetical protein